MEGCPQRDTAGLSVSNGAVSAQQDVARVARWMAGKAVGLVLSGGGSRGLAHLGVLHALDDAGVPIDVIGGTSQVCPRTPVLHSVHLRLKQMSRLIPSMLINCIAETPGKSVQQQQCRGLKY